MTELLYRIYTLANIAWVCCKKTCDTHTVVTYSMFVNSDPERAQSAAVKYYCLGGLLKGVRSPHPHIYIYILLRPKNTVFAFFLRSYLQ